MSVLPLPASAVESVIRAGVSQRFGVAPSADAAPYPLEAKAYAVGLRALLTVPLIVRNEVVGALSVRSHEPHICTQAHQTFLERVGEQVAGAIVNAQLYQQYQQAEAQFRSLVEGSSQGAFIHRNAILLFANQALADILGYATPGDILTLGSTMEFIAPMNGHDSVAIRGCACRVKRSRVTMNCKRFAKMARKSGWTIRPACSPGRVHPPCKGHFYISLGTNVPKRRYASTGSCSTR